MNKRLTRTRLILAIISTGLEEVAIWAVWTRVFPGYGIRLPWLPLIIIMVAWAAFCTWLFVFTTRTLKRQSQAGISSIVGMRGKVTRPLDPDGMVKIRGEFWGAVSDEGKIEAGTEIVVVGQNGLKLSVRKTNGGEIKR
jgi:membrane-bound ClpP family serine protease